jgi:hypothetical protein
MRLLGGCVAAEGRGKESGGFTCEEEDEDEERMELDFRV